MDKYGHVCVVNLYCCKIVLYTRAYPFFHQKTNHGSVEPWREGKGEWERVPAVEQVFKDHKRGTAWTNDDLKAAFETDDIPAVMKIIATKGELQKTSDDRKKVMDEKKKQIVTYIHKYYIHPKTKKPHPVAHIEAAIQSAKMRIDPDTSASEQVNAAYSKLCEHLALKKTEMNGILRIPHASLGQAQGVIRKYCQINSENYDQDGVAMNVSFVPGDYDSLIGDLNTTTKGNFQFDVDGLQGAATSEADDEGKGKKGKKGKGKKGKRK